MHILACICVSIVRDNPAKSAGIQRLPIKSLEDMEVHLKSYRKHAIIILNNILPGLDVNDIPKSTLVFQVIFGGVKKIWGGDEKTKGPLFDFFEKIFFDDRKSDKMVPLYFFLPFRISRGRGIPFSFPLNTPLVIFTLLSGHKGDCDHKQFLNCFYNWKILI